MESRKLKSEFQSLRKPRTQPERKGGRKEYLKALKEFGQRQVVDVAKTLAELSLCDDDKMESQDENSTNNQKVECNPTETGGGIPVTFSDSRMESSQGNLEFSKCLQEHEIIKRPKMKFSDSNSIKSEEFNGVFMFKDIKTAVEKPMSSFVTDVVNSNERKRKLNDTTRTRYSFIPASEERRKCFGRTPRDPIQTAYWVNKIETIKRNLIIKYNAMENSTCTRDDN